jgi:murein DD-endopeptidase MepM/ murein hydrolase activator NlpD
MPVARRLWWIPAAGGLAAGWVLVVAIFAVVLGQVPAASQCPPGPPDAAPSPRGASEIPAALLPLYSGAAGRYGLGPSGWAWLASINRQETDFGRNLSTSSAGAVGWMQFLPSTWRIYGVDVHHSGRADPFDPADAIYAAARYLRASGAPGDWHRAVLAYNPAEWYYQQVAQRARTYLSQPGVASPGPSAACASAQPAALVGSYALPLDRRYMRVLGRTDDGVDIETAPDGATVYSMTPGRCTAVASDPRGFGPAYPVIQAGSGPLAGQSIYYGHVARALVHGGEQVVAGQPIAVIGHTGDAARLGHGHIEIGFSTATGDPLSHHGASAWTPDGQRMRDFLIRLDAAAGIQTR